MIEQRARDYFKISPEQPVHVNAWAASQQAYWREQYNEKRAAEKALAPQSRKAPRRNLPPEFSRSWEGHTAEFREEITNLARKDKGLPSDAYISALDWKIACHKRYERTEVMSYAIGAGGAAVSSTHSYYELTERNIMLGSSTQETKTAPATPPRTEVSNLERFR
jgi:hypothetical protein